MENRLDYASLNFNELKPPQGSDRDRDNRYYEIVGGGARLQLMETMLIRVRDYSKHTIVSS